MILMLFPCGRVLLWAEGSKCRSLVFYFCRLLLRLRTTLCFGWCSLVHCVVEVGQCVHWVVPSAVCSGGIQESGQVCWQNTGILDSYLKTQLNSTQPISKLNCTQHCPVWLALCIIALKYAALHTLHNVPSCSELNFPTHRPTLLLAFWQSRDLSFNILN